MEAYKLQDDVTTSSNIHHRQDLLSSLSDDTAENYRNSSVSIPKQSPFNKTSSSSASFSACLMLNDDNHWLSEWLPYHYQTARLRNLLVIVDPSSRTSTKHIFDRWKDRIKIVQWKDKDFMKNIKKKKKKGKKYAHKALIQRQLAFYRSCILHFKRKTKDSWLMLTDADEFLRMSHIHNRSISNTMEEVDTTKEGYLADFLELTASDRTCLTIARYQLTSQEDNHTTHDQLKTNELIQDHFNTSNFMTFRWMYHNGKTMNHGKSLINLKNLKKKKVPKNLASVHLPIKGICPPNPPGSTKDSASNSVALQHYLGSWEQFSFRKDLRNSKDRLDRWKVAGRHGIRFRDNSMSPWLRGFVQQVGLSEAERLLKDVGVVEAVP